MSTDPTTSTAGTTPPAPEPAEPESWDHFELWKNVRDTVYALPDFFESTLNVSGVLATDLHAFNNGHANPGHADAEGYAKESITVTVVKSP